MRPTSPDASLEQEAVNGIVCIFLCEFRSATARSPVTHTYIATQATHALASFAKDFSTPSRSTLSKRQRATTRNQHKQHNGLTWPTTGRTPNHQRFDKIKVIPGGQSDVASTRTTSANDADSANLSNDLTQAHKPATLRHHRATGRLPWQGFFLFATTMREESYPKGSQRKQRPCYGEAAMRHMQWACIYALVHPRWTDVRSP